MQEDQVVPSIFDEQKVYYDPASVTQRFVNYLIDMVLFYLFIYLLFAAIGIVMALSGMQQDEIVSSISNPFLTYSITILAFIIYFTLIEGISKGRSMGKLITGTKAVREDTIGPITWRNALMRSLCRLIPFEVFSALNGNPWHDSMTKTLVIKKNLVNHID